MKMEKITKKIGWLLGLSILLLSGCMTEVDLEHLRKQPRVVLNARVAANDTVTARVTRTWFYTEDEPDIFLKDAEVDLWVNGAWRERMIGWEKGEGHIADEQFVSGYVCQPGDRIRIMASHPDYGEASAEVTVPFATPILDVKREYRTIVEAYSVRHITDYDITFRDDPGEKNYYMLQIENGSPFRMDSLDKVRYRWSSLSLDFSRSPALDGGKTTLDKIFRYEQEYYWGSIFPDDSFNGEEFVLKVSTFFYTYSSGGSIGYDPDHGYGGRSGASSGRTQELADDGEPDSPAPPHLLRINLYSLSESYYFYLRSLVSLAGYSIVGDLANIGLAAPVRVYSNVTEGGTGLLGAMADFCMVIHQEETTKAGSASQPH